ncbi:unnamed protein product [Rotaria sordida]|uniref:Major facilitator superfamily (MFS) profile domain-containing protein n=1 Tax=Rotaria sordida TaxID=392033 RepID=A0A819STT2_9BILA|nr:unnamed protein product [Rotaria sordida]CAF1146440.1 unnamed protein product [Rotaria sordida]CAF4067442.1 unnamed protein product [Rotaria sordida]CAF4095077.1 unnamed protein product [Rotaria sordida]
MISKTSESVLIVSSSQTKPPYVLYSQRFYVLLIFSFLSFNQCLIWLTFAPIARSTEAYYKISEATVDLLLNWGPIMFIPCLPLTYILLNKHHGLRRCIVLLSITDFIATLVRIIPIIITTPSSPNFSRISLVFLHVGQILNATCGPLVMAPVSQLSCLWFAPHERTRATTIAVFASNFGWSIGFVISPFIVSSCDYIPYLLYVHLGLAFIACVLALLFFPSQPPSAPSAAAELLIHYSLNEHNNNSWKKFVNDIWQCLTTPSFVLILIAGGLLPGTSGAWTSLYDVILKPENYTEQQAGWFSFGSSIAGIIGGLFLSFLADRRRFQHSLKTLIVITYIGCLFAIIWFELSVQSFFFDKPILPSNAATIGLSTALVGLFSGAGFPLIFEALAEIMFPLPESLSASILAEWTNVITLILLFIAPNRYKLMNILVLIVTMVCILIIALARFTYTRRDEDERKRLEKEQNQILNEDSLNPYNKSITNESQYGTFS